MRVLAGDIGGTKTLLQIAEVQAAHAQPLVTRRYESAHHASFAGLVREFLADPAVCAAGDASAACFAVAGPVMAGAAGEAVRVTNLPWVIESSALAREFGMRRVRLVNDFQAVGYGIEALRPADLAVLQEGIPRAHGARAVLGAGTGLGQAILVWRRDHYEVLPTEGGHADFAPADEEQVGLWRYLRGRHGRATWERVLSGPGLADIYSFVCASAGAREAFEAVPDAERPAAISAAAIAGSDAQATTAIELFVRVYGAQAGNLALATLALGGVYLAGGIAPKLLPQLRAGDFLRAFCDKGRMAGLLRDVPVAVVLNEEIGLLGAALAAARAG